MYKVELTTGGQKFETEGETIESALKDIKLSWEEITYKGVLKVTKGKNKWEQLLYRMPLRRLFANKIRRSQYANQIEKFLK